MEKFLSFKISKELYEALTKKSRSLNVGLASTVRIALSEYLRDYLKENEK